MKYFLIAGEASGDLHAANLMRALRDADPAAEFRCYGGDLMQAAGGMLLCHYRDLAFMGFFSVLRHLPAILRGMRRCKAAIAAWRPDAVILVDYPGFNLAIARYVRAQRLCPVFYYIAPKIWAWKEYRIRNIRRDVNRLFSILPFEVDFFERKHGYAISYVGNPTVDEVAAYRATHFDTLPTFAARHGLTVGRPLIALLAGSRRSEIKSNLVRMCRAAAPFAKQGYQLVVAGAPSVPQAFYDEVLSALGDERASLDLHLLDNCTYDLLAHAKAALVTSGTATLETALFRVPQVVCYHTAAGRFVSLLRRLVLKVKYISLVNLVCDREVVPELVADGMTIDNVRRHLAAILPGGAARERMLDDYREMAARLGSPGAPQRAAAEMVRLLSGIDDIS